MSAGDWLVRWLPRELRTAYGPEIARLLRARIAEERRRRGRLRGAAYTLRALLDLASTGARARFSGRDRPPGPPKGRLRGAAAALPGDVRFALRTLRREPAFTLAAVATLACSVAVTTAVVGVVDAVLLRPPSAFEDPASLVMVYSWRPDRQELRSLSYPDYQDLAASDVFSGLTVLHRTAINLGDGDASMRIRGELVDTSYFEVLGVSPVMGRGFSAADDGERFVVISHPLWVRLGEPADVVGDTVRLNGHLYVVIGVAPPRFRGTRADGAPDAWVPVRNIGDFLAFPGEPLDGSGAQILERRGFMTFELAGRLAPGVGAEDAQRRVEEIAASIRERLDGYGLELRIAPLRWGAFRPRDRAEVTRYGAMLAAVSAVVLLIGCVNVANLLLARAADRRREIAVRRALGASRVRLFAQLFTESFVLAAVAGVAGIALVAAGLPLLRSLRLPAGIEADLHLDSRVALLAAMLSVAAVVVFGVVPAMRACFAGIDVPRRAGRPLPGLRWDGRATMVAAQLALAVMLVVAAGLLTRTWINLRGVDAGFDARDVLTASVDPELAGYDEDSGMTFYRRLLPRLDRLAGVRAVAMTTDVPLQDLPSGGPLFFDSTGPEPQFPIGQSIVSPRYFEALGIELLAGRGFTLDDTPDAHPVVVINQALARRFWPGTSALGRSVRATPDGPAAEVVGIVADYRHASLREPPGAHLYWPQLQVYTWLKGSAIRTLLVATHGDPVAQVGAIRAEVAAIDPLVPLFDVATLRERVADASAIERQSAAILVGFAAAGFLLAGVGLFGSLSYMVSRRRGELGVRAALGASPGGLFAQVVRTGLGVAAAGGAAGLVLSALATRLIDRWLYGVDPWDGVTLAVMVGTLMLVAVLATLPVAARAAGTDPLAVMRAE